MRTTRRLFVLCGVLLLLATASAYTGQILPFDVIAGFTLRITNAFLLSVPYIGPDLAFAGLLLFGLPGLLIGLGLGWLIWG